MHSSWGSLVIRDDRSPGVQTETLVKTSTLAQISIGLIRSVIGKLNVSQDEPSNNIIEWTRGTSGPAVNNGPS